MLFGYYNQCSVIISVKPYITCEIYEALGKAFDGARIANNVPNKTVLAQENVSSDALNKFRKNNGGITLLNPNSG